MERLFGFVIFLPAMGKDSFSEMNKDIAVSYSKVAKDCMLEAVNEVHSGADDNLLCDIAMWCDGTWQKRGFSSLLGAVTDTGKCLDYKVMSKQCPLCTLWESRKGTDAYGKFVNVIRDLHECSINHDGSAVSMEAKGVVECFSTSIEKYNLQYTEYLGDGDSKSYKDVSHRQKYEQTSKVLRIAVRGKIQEMKRDIAAALYHCCEFNTDEQRHMFFPKTEMSWCKYQADIVNDTKTYKYKSGIHNKMSKLAKPVFMELSDDELLRKCLHGKTQNTNESVNDVI